LVDLYYSDPELKAGANQAHEINFYKNVSSELGLPFSADLILCNPPWLPANHLPETSPLDNGVYDSLDQHFLKSALNFARVHLAKEGEMLLIFSDLAYQLGLLEEDRI
jgi:methylase of polypeptide subunit release factors